MEYPWLPSSFFLIADVGIEDGALTILLYFTYMQPGTMMNSMADTISEAEPESNYREEVENSAKEIFDKEDMDQLKDQENDFNGGSDDS
jgi:hypothetical protein